MENLEKSRSEILDILKKYVKIDNNIDIIRLLTIYTSKITEAYIADRYKKILYLSIPFLNNDTIIGKGTFGSVYSILDVNNNKYIVKKISKKLTNDTTFKNEINTLNFIKNNCKKYFVCYNIYIETNNNYYILMEYLNDYDTLFNIVRYNKINEDVLSTLIYNLINGLQLMHNYKISHLDIKPDNIMVNPNNGNIKYIDFGLSCIGNRCNNLKLQGTYMYIPMELLQIRMYDGFNDAIKQDIWGLGNVLYFVITKKIPFTIWNNDNPQLKSLNIYDRLFVFFNKYNRYKNLFNIPDFKRYNDIVIDTYKKINIDIYPVFNLDLNMLTYPRFMHPKPIYNTDIKINKQNIDIDKTKILSDNISNINIDT